METCAAFSGGASMAAEIHTGLGEFNRYHGCPLARSTSAWPRQPLQRVSVCRTRCTQPTTASLPWLVIPRGATAVARWNKSPFGGGLRFWTYAWLFAGSILHGNVNVAAYPAPQVLWWDSPLHNCSTAIAFASASLALGSGRTASSFLFYNRPSASVP